MTAHVPGESEGTHPTYGYVADKDVLVRRLRRIQGQARGIERMVVEDRYCIDILTQVAAITTALEAVAELLLKDHISHCVRHALTAESEEVADEKMQELLDAVRRFAKIS